MNDLRDDPALTGETTCPECGAAIPIDDGYAVWCDRCDWNLKPQQPRAAQTFFESLYVRLGARLGDELFDDIARRGLEPPGISLSVALAYLCAGLVHGLTLFVGVAGLVLLLGAVHHGWMAVVGVLCLCIAWFVRPRVPRSTYRGVTREQAPHLYALADRVALALGARPIGKIVLDSSCGASLQREGWRGSYVLTIGLRLFGVLTQQERVALIAHEMAHQVNGDSARSRIVTLALSALARWYAVLRPLRIALSLGFTEIVYLYAMLLSHLCWRTSQRAEYRADLLSARVAGTAAVLSLLDKLYLTESLRTVPAGRHSDDGITVFDELRQRLAAVPAREWERIRRVERLQASRLDSTHPPTAYRISLLEAAPAVAPAVVLSGEEAANVSAELARIERMAHERIVATMNKRTAG